MIHRACLDCGALIAPNARRCLVHARARDRGRGTTKQRGYGSVHKREAKDAIEGEPWCHWPGCYATTDLTAQHLVPGDGEAGYTVLCRKHNSVDANQRRARRRVPGGGVATEW